jgi:hypothetical protein
MTSQPPRRSRRSAWYRALPVIVASLIPVAGLCDPTTETRPPTTPGDVLIAQPNWLIRQSALCDAALLRAEKRYQLPHQLLTSIARVESGRPITSLADTRPWPWTIDADGMGLFVDSKAAAIAWMKAQAANHNFVDVGCMQVDLYYHPHAFASLEEAFDPVANADYAARLLLELYRGEAGGSWDLAVGLYHSHTSLLAAEYRDRVAMVGADVLHGNLRSVPLYVRAIHQGTLRLQLANGKVTLLNVHRQPARRSLHPYTACQVEQILGPYLAGARRGICGARSPPRADAQWSAGQDKQFGGPQTDAAVIKADAAR